jgi:hypothetical protein
MIIAIWLKDRYEKQSYKSVGSWYEWLILKMHSKQGFSKTHSLEAIKELVYKIFAGCQWLTPVILAI